MKNLRIRRKNHDKYKSIFLNPSTPAERVELDRNVFDLVLKELFENADQDEMDLERDILAKSKIKLHQKESRRLWEVLTSSGWISPAIGFGKAGKLELTKAGMQMMTQFGGYSQYLAAMQTNNQPQTIIMPIQVEADDTPALPAAQKKEQK
jgi:hypothetical protein